MYETEANKKTESSEQIPADVITRLGEARSIVLGRTVLPWSEHCTECVWPTCYKSCDLYSAREDGKCRRFVNGMVRVNCSEAMNSYVLKVTFKRWGKLWAPGNIRLQSVEKAFQLERRDFRIGTTLYQLPLPLPMRKFVTGKRYSIKKRLAYRANIGEAKPSSFFLECYNPNSQSVRLSLTIRSVDAKLRVPFQQLIELDPGFHRVRVPYPVIAGVVDLSVPFNIELIPNDDSKEVTLLFGLMDFVREKLQPEAELVAAAPSPKKIKCVVWDLDNTLWDGILVEDGDERLTLKVGIRDIIEQLDQRGILQSVASKNNREEALAVLRREGMEEFFLAPQISWLPKSEGIKEIARQLNIGLDSLLFVDDSEFELRQVSATLPDVRNMNARDYRSILGLDECDVPVTAESKERRKMYRVEEQRRAEADNFADDYMAFLRHCDIKLSIRPMIEENIERVHELTQRTNQMNFSGNRYSRAVLEQIFSTSYLETHVLEVDDRFGSYGVVGFCIVDTREPLMTDLMFSCRIQSKRVEHAFLAHIIRQYVAKTGKDFRALYRKTPRNSPSGQVFADIGMKELENQDGVSLLLFAKERVVPDDGLVTITVHESSSVA
jgi:FkbH-like protein